MAKNEVFLYILKDFLFGFGIYFWAVSVVRDLVHGQVAYERIIPFTRHKSWVACVGGSKNVSNSSATKVSRSRCTRIVVTKVLEIRDYLR